jgi:hypothetical protein
MKNRVAIKIGLLMVLFSILSQIVLSMTILLVLLFLGYLIINTKSLEKFGLVLHSEKSEEMDTLFEKGLKYMLFVNLTIATYHFINRTFFYSKISTSNHRIEEYLKGISYYWNGYFYCNNFLLHD